MKIQILDSWKKRIKRKWYVRQGYEWVLIEGVEVMVHPKVLATMNYTVSTFQERIDECLLLGKLLGYSITFNCKSKNQYGLIFRDGSMRHMLIFDLYADRLDVRKVYCWTFIGSGTSAMSLNTEDPLHKLREKL